MDNLRGMRDAIPEPRYGLKRIIHAQGRVPEMLQLLQHRIGQAGQKRITAQHQHRQAVRMGQRGSGQKVRRSRTRRGGAKHETLTQAMLGIGRRGESHALFVLPAIQRQIRRGDRKAPRPDK